MLRSVFELDLVQARDIVGAAKYPASAQTYCERLFSYGTLQQENVQLATFGRLLKGAPDALVGFKQELVEITDPDVLAKSGKPFHPIVMYSGNDADRVAGTVFEITAAELASADAYEVADYERVAAQLASGATAWVYVKR